MDVSVSPVTKIGVNPNISDELHIVRLQNLLMPSCSLHLNNEDYL